MESSPGPFDRILAIRFGVAAVDSIMKQRFGTMVSVQGPDNSGEPAVCK
ncbi:MAG: hypothetical protein ABRQ23_02130 [Syntrophomonadaceae bacterium]